MESCKHEVLVLAPVQSSKVRCRHCHLTISEEELGDGCCPECLEAYKVRRRDFDKITTPDTGTTRYCCERCGLIVEC